MNQNNYDKRISIQEQLQDIGKEIDTLAQSTMIKEIVYMFAENLQLNECEQIILYFRAKINSDDLNEIKEYILKKNNYELKI